MKYILFIEGPAARGKLGPEPDKVQEKVKIRTDEEKYGKVILEPHFYGTGKGVLIVDFDNPQQIANRLALGEPELTYKIHPLFSGDEWGKARRDVWAVRG